MPATIRSILERQSSSSIANPVLSKHITKLEGTLQIISRACNELDFKVAARAVVQFCRTCRQVLIVSPDLTRTKQREEEAISRYVNALEQFSSLVNEFREQIRNDSEDEKLFSIAIKNIGKRFEEARALEG